MNVTEQQVKQLTAIGFLAADHGLNTEGEAIFHGLSAFRPDSEYPLIGLALTQIGAGRHDAALSTLNERALRVNPASATAKCFVGLALKLAGRVQESERWLQEVAATADDQDAKTLAENLLAEAA
ncbi:MAG TPA: hypothetical protein PLP22_11860 [Candidatus Competibacter sp.]|nr:hypothetical protein [Candidatus Competibacteraceae bacterium]HAO34173.1 hypothetical protein [Candidatus Competibacteraceae bacterium]HRE55472.1 hypothetical protein [Candidatus Competibacter sp.]HUM95860.1 hypothetical protein [Candidatus Competibacter sp.]